MNHERFGSFAEVYPMRQLLAALLLFTFLLVPVDRLLAQQRFGFRAIEKSIEIDGRTRKYLVYVPKRASGWLPLLMVLHGGGDKPGRGLKGRQMERYTRFNAIARRERFIVCYPEGYEGNWNDGRGVEFIAAHKENVDDVKFLRQVVEAIGKVEKLDRSRVFVTGISNGAFMSHRLAAEASDLFAGIAPLVGGMPTTIAENFKPQYPVSLFVIQGDSDPLVPFDGGEVGYRLGRKRGKFIPTTEAVARYVKLNEIAGEPTVSMLKDKEPDDGTATEVTDYPAGKGTAGVRMYVVKNGGHTWPGRPGYLPERLIGKSSQDFDASEEIWKFFKSCPARQLAR
jgi:polyhydroxybutyrate depolymerase